MNTTTRFLVVFLLSLLLSGCQQSEAKPAEEKQQDFGAEKAPLPDNSKSMDGFRFAVSRVVDKVVPVVVSINTQSTVKVQQNPYGMFPFGDLFGIPRQRQQPREMPRRQGLGSGVIVSKEGYILTNNHVVEDADKIMVTLHDDREFEAEVVGTDPQTDVAVIKLKEKVKDLPLAYLGESERLKVGEWVVAVGSPYGLNKTITTGIVSAKGVHNRGITSYENFIQTDAAINPGNSGGGLFTLDGALIGINTAIVSRSGGFNGIGFAIPIDLAKSIADDLIDDGEVSRGWLGVGIQEVDQDIAEAMDLKEPGGVLINQIFPETPAAKAGLKTGDLVLEIDGEKVPDVNTLRNRIALVRPGQTIEMTILRDGKQQKIKVKIGSRDPEQAAASAVGEQPANLGLKLRPVSKDERNVYPEYALVVEAVKPDGVGAEAGIRPGDAILSLNRQQVDGVDDFYKKMAVLTGKKRTVLLFIQRGENRLYLALKPGE